MVEAAKEADITAIELKDRGLAALLAWLIPGLGHWYQDRRGKAVLYFISIMGLFIYGVWLGGNGTLGYGRAAYFSWRADDFQFLKTFQIGVGLPALPALIQAYRMADNERVLFGGFMAPPRLPAPRGDDRQNKNVEQPTLHELYRQLHRYFELAGFFTMVAGLLNVLAIYDAWAGPVFVAPAGEKEKR